MPQLEIKNLCFSYGKRQVIHQLNLSIEQAQFTVILGANGCGKTTLLKNISGYLQPSLGQVLIAPSPREAKPGQNRRGQDVQKMSVISRARQISFVSQDTSEHFSFSAYDVVMMGRTPYLKRFQRESPADRQIVQNAMELTDTWTLKDRLITELSGGEKQRVYLARSLAQQPQILLLDEPLSHMDLKFQMSTLSLLKNLARQGMLILAVLHDINLASQYADEIIIMKEGSIISRGKPQDIVNTEHLRHAFAVDVDIVPNPRTRMPIVIPYQ
ncbi:MAG: ABC transporter ATP-binding protein [Peptococcia bacterium]|jgi:iron complex transport system ATP-binding protein